MITHQGEGDDTEHEDSEGKAMSDGSTRLGVMIEVVTLARNLIFAVAGGALLSAYLEGRLGQNDTWVWHVLIFAVLIALSNLHLVHIRRRRLDVSSPDDRESDTY